MAALEVPLSAFVVHEIVRSEVLVAGRRIVARRIQGLGTPSEVTLADREARLEAGTRWLVDAAGVAVLRLEAEPLSPHAAPGSPPPKWMRCLCWFRRSTGISSQPRSPCHSGRSRITSWGAATSWSGYTRS